MLVADVDNLTPRYAPQLHAGRHPDLSVAQVVRSVNEVRKWRRTRALPPSCVS